MPEDVFAQSDQSARAAVMEQAAAIAGEMPSPTLRSLVCPYCGTVTADTGRCSACNGRFDPLSRQATQNQMGPWSIRDDRTPFRPGCTYETIVGLVGQGKISLETVLRGPSTRQFWTLARHAPGVAHLLGVCHSCQGAVKSDAFACPRCHASFTTERDRQHLGLGPSRPLPGQGLPEVLALHAEPASPPGFREVQARGNSGANTGAAGGVASTPIGAQAQQGSGGSGGAEGDGVGGLAQAQEAARLARRWKMAWEVQRRRAWIAIGISALITLGALAYAAMGPVRASQKQSGAQSAQVPVSLDE